MKTLILIYLLIKSALGRTITNLDSLLAFAIAEDDPASPEWLRMIANMELEAPLPEAFAHFRFDLEARVEEWMQ